MSKKSRRKAEAARKEQERLEAEQQRAAEARKKVFLLRFYERMFPGDYTEEQDRKHLLGMCGLCLLLAAVIGICCFVNAKNNEYSVSARLVIPASSFVTGQEGTVTQMLAGYGFKDMQSDDDGNIVSYGTPEMVEAYKNSYEERSLKLARQKIDAADFGGGVAAISVDDDAKNMTVTTYWDVTENSTFLSAALTDKNVQDIIDTYSIWCQMRNDGEKMTISFADSESGNVYFTTQQTTANSIIADKEAAERAESSDDEVGDTSQETPETSGEEPTGGEEEHQEEGD